MASIPVRDFALATSLASDDFFGLERSSTTNIRHAYSNLRSQLSNDFALTGFLTTQFGQFSGGVSNLGNTAGDTGTVTNRVVLAGGNNITLSQSTDGNGATVTISAGAGGGGITAINVSAGTTSNNLTAFTLSNSNGISFGLDGSTITGSHNALTSQSNQAVSAGNGSVAFQTISFSNANGVSFSTAAGPAIVASVATSLTNINVSAGTTSNNLSALTFADGNGVSFGIDGSTITASITPAGGAQTGISGIQVSDTTYTSGTVTFRNANGISFGSSGANGISASYTVPSVPAPQTGISGIEVSNTTYTSGTVTFRNANGISFGSSGANGISASYTVPAVTNSSWTVSDAATSGTVGRLAFTNLNGVTFSLSTGAGGSHTIVGSHNAITSQSNQTLGLYAVGNTTGQSSSSTFDARTLSFVGQGIASVGFSNGSVNISVPAGAPSPVNFSAGTTSSDLGSVVFSNSNGVSFGLNGSTITASVNAGGGGVTHSYFQPPIEGVRLSYSWGQATLHVQPQTLPDLHIQHLLLPVWHSNATNQSGSFTLSFWFGMYTKNAGTLSLLHSTSRSYAFTGSGTVGSYSQMSGMRNAQIAWTTTVTAGDYWIGYINRTTSGGANATWSGIAHGASNTVFAGPLGTASNASQQARLGWGLYATSTTALPGSIQFNQIIGSDSRIQRTPIFAFCGSTH